jgi:hypothetical protein
MPLQEGERLRLPLGVLGGVGVAFDHPSAGEQGEYEQQ